jgi:hypothetical protein
MQASTGPKIVERLSELLNFFGGTGVCEFLILINIIHSFTQLLGWKNLDKLAIMHFFTSALIYESFVMTPVR